MSNPNSVVESLSAPQTERSRIPPELIILILHLLSHEDRCTFSLLSKSARQLAFPILFRKISYFRNVPYRIERLNKAGSDVKAAIRQLMMNDNDCSRWNLSVLWELLKSLPNLHTFRWNGLDHQCSQSLPQLVASLQHCPLEHFTFWIPGDAKYAVAVAAPPRLKTLSLVLHHPHVYELIQPSFSTLVELDVWLYFADPGSVALDLLPLRPVGKTLRKLVYRVECFHPEILDSIPDVFPHLTALHLTFWNTTQESLWKESYDQAIIRNTELQHLTVSATRFTFCHVPFIHGACHACEDQRRKATHALAMASTGLKYSRWDHGHYQYWFDVNVFRNSSEGNTSLKIDIKPSSER